MLFKKFTYTKSDGQISDRSVVVLKKAADYDTCIDVTELDPLAFETFIDDMKLFEEKYKRKLNKLLANYNLTSNFRNFKINRMSEITTIED